MCNKQPYYLMYVYSKFVNVLKAVFKINKFNFVWLVELERA